MKQLIFVMFILGCLFIPATASAQPVPYPYYEVVRYCHTVLIPYPHSKCEWVHIRRDYRPVHRHYTPAPPPPRHHHPAPPPGHGPHHNHGPHHGHR